MIGSMKNAAASQVMSQMRQMSLYLSVAPQGTTSTSAPLKSSDVQTV